MKMENCSKWNGTWKTPARRRGKGNAMKPTVALDLIFALTAHTHTHDTKRFPDCDHSPPTCKIQVPSTSIIWIYLFLSVFSELWFRFLVQVITALLFLTGWKPCLEVIAEPIQTNFLCSNIPKHNFVKIYIWIVLLRNSHRIRLVLDLFSHRSIPMQCSNIAIQHSPQ